MTENKYVGERDGERDEGKVAGGVMMVDGVVDKSKFTDKRKSREKRILVSWILKIKLGVMDSWWWIRFVVITNFFLSFSIIS